MFVKTTSDEAEDQTLERRVIVSVHDSQWWMSSGKGHGVYTVSGLLEAEGTVDWNRQRRRTDLVDKFSAPSIDWE